MIEVTGMLRFTVGFNLEIDMTEAEWDELSERKQNEIIDEMIGTEEMQGAEMDDCDVWDVKEITPEEVS